MTETLGDSGVGDKAGRDRVGGRSEGGDVGGGRHREERAGDAKSA